MNNGKGILLDGIVVNVFPSEVYGNFEKRIVWLKEPGETRYPETWAVEFQQGDCNQLDSFTSGMLITVTIDIKGKLFSKAGKEIVFNTLKATGIQLKGEVKKVPSLRQQTGKY